jgi:cystathionine beta-synthase
VTDKESFLWTRHLVKEEGIFYGGSSGSATATEVSYVQQLDPEHPVAVILPESGSRYLAKFFYDKWIRENGFFDIEWGEVSLQELIEAKAGPGLICATLGMPMTEVINQMKEYDICQIPTLNPDGTLAG